MKTLLLTFGVLTFFSTLKAQTFWTEAFENSCSSDCLAAGTNTGNGAWSVTSTGSNGDMNNLWYISCAENGQAAGVCGAGCGSDESLHIGSQTAGDLGAAYDAGGLCGFLWCTNTDLRAESPTINCTGYSNITLAFNYIENGQTTLDDATLWWFNGTVWAQLTNLAKTAICGGQGMWTAYSTVLPAGANNNPNVKIGFRWVNNDDGLGTDPSFAVDDITLSVAAASNTITTGTITGSPFCACATVNVPFTSTGTFTAGNVYTAQLSNSAGSFAAPASIGTLTSTANSGTITATIPCNTSAGTGYRIRVISSAPSTTGTDNGVNITINATPSIPTISTTVATCSAAGTATITNYSGTQTYTFSPAGPSVGGGGVISGMTPGTSYTVTTSNGTCTSAASASFSIAAQLTVPSVPAVSTTAATCSAAGTATITNYSGTLTYTFSPAGPSAGGGGVITGMTAGTSYAVTAGNGSCSSAASASFSIAAQLTTPSVPAVSTTAATCSAAGTATITNYSGTLTYTFSPAGPSAGGGVISGMTAGTSYTVTAGNGTCTSAASTSFSIAAQLTVPSVPTVSTTAATCSSAGTATITNYSGTLTYTFSPAGPTAGGGGVISGMTAGTSYTVTAGNGSCSSAASASFSIAAQLTVPSVPAVSTTAATCSAAGTATITNYSGTFTYTFSPAGPSAGGGGVISGMTAGTSYTVTAGNGTCTSAASSSFSIGAQTSAPSIPAVTTAAATCSSNGTATITNYSGTLTYSFSPAGPSAGGGGVISGMTPGTSYTVSASDGSCSSSASASFSIAAQLTTPSVPAVSTTAATCSANGTATVTNYSGTLTYSFSPAGPTVGSGGSISGMTPGTSYTVSANDGVCSSSASTSFSISSQIAAPPAPTASVTVQPTCTSPTGTIVVSAPNGATIEYSIGGAYQSSGTFSGLAPNTYNVTAQDNSTGCISSATVLTVNTASGAPSITVDTQTDVTCFAGSDGSASVSVSGGTTPYTYNWSPSGGSGSSATNLAAGTYTVTVTDAVNCSSTETITIVSPAQISIVEAVTDVVCGTAAGMISTSVSGGDGTYTYSWTPNSETTSGISNLAAGSYGVTVTDGNGCTTSESYSVGTSGSLSVIITPASSVILAGSSVQLSATGGTTYDWAPTTGLSCTDCPDPIASPTTTTIYTVTATDALGCSGTGDALVTVDLDCGPVYVPNIFSPNGSGDALNDKFTVRGLTSSCAISYHMEIFDRWGEKVFETTDINVHWDGTYKGKAMNSGVYFYKLNATLWDNSTLEESGNCTLVR